MSRLMLAKQLIDVLRQAGVERIHGVVGDSRNIPRPARVP